MHETLKGDRSNTLTDNLGVRGSAPPLSPAQKEDLYQRLTFDQETLINLCQRWQIQEFALFGSVLREDFRPDSDIDVLITFLPNDPWNLFDIITLKQELETLTQRSVDVVEKKQLRNPYRRAEILKTYQTIYLCQPSTETSHPSGI